MLAVVTELLAKAEKLMSKLRPYYRRLGNLGSWSHDSIRSWIKLPLHQPIIWMVDAKPV
jgi:hypothetical protein